MLTLQATEPTSVQTLQVATFSLGELILGIDIDKIREITCVGGIAPVADAHPSVRGITNLRGEVVTVLDLRTILDLESVGATSRSRLVILRDHEEHVGVLVDQVMDVVNVCPEQQEPLPANIDGLDGRYFLNVCKLDLDLVVRLDVNAVLALHTS